MRCITCLVLSLFLASCYRTHYVNFSPQNPDRAPAATAAAPVRSGGGWQDFFLYGWVPGELTIDARQKCRGAENVDSVRTRRTFLEGLVAAVAGFYINIYSPWDGAVYCQEAPSR
ncbi:MAG: hypothetical protein ABFS46_14135 [Myxococcota bacterium]